MALRACRECGREVSTEATTCPHCGAPNPTVLIPLHIPEVPDQWWYGQAGRTVGPLTLEGLRNEFPEGMPPKTPIWTGKEWKTADSMPDLASFLTPLHIPEVPDRWWYSQAGRSVGPLTVEELTKEFPEGIPSKTLIWTGTKWKTADSIPDLAPFVLTSEEGTPTQLPPTNPPAGKRWGKVTLIGCLSIFGLFLIIGIVGTILDETVYKEERQREEEEREENRRIDEAMRDRQEEADRAERDAEDRKSEAWIRCQRWVEERLSSPSSADFPWFSNDRVSRSGNRYTVESHFDAENRFGATIRADFTCIAEYDNDRWRPETVEIRER